MLIFFTCESLPAREEGNDGGKSAQKLFQFSPFYRKLRTIQYLAFYCRLFCIPLLSAFFLPD